MCEKEEAEKGGDSGANWVERNQNKRKRKAEEEECGEGKANTNMAELYKEKPVK